MRFAGLVAHSLTSRTPWVVTLEPPDARRLALPRRSRNNRRATGAFHSKRKQLGSRQQRAPCARPDQARLSARPTVSAVLIRAPSSSWRLPELGGFYGAGWAAALSRPTLECWMRIDPTLGLGAISVRLQVFAPPGATSHSYFRLGRRACLPPRLWAI